MRTANSKQYGMKRQTLKQAELMEDKNQDYMVLVDNACMTRVMTKFK